MPATDRSRPFAMLSAPGSRGDVNPMLALGSGLRQAGCEVAVTLAEPYAPLAQQLGLHPIPLLSTERFEAMIRDPQLWRPLGGPRALLRDMIPETLAAHYQSLVAQVRPGRSVLVAHPLDMASRIYRDAHPDVPLVSVHLAPALLRVPQDPPRMTPWLVEPRGPAAAVRVGYWLVDRLLVDRWLTPELNRFRRSLRLKPVDRPLDRWWLSPDRVIGLYPSWFAPEEASWPPQFRPVGFPLYDGPEATGPALGSPDSGGEHAGGNEAARAVEHVLAGFDEPPIVFTPGTAHVRAAEFFQAAAAACQQLSRPGLMLTSRPEQAPGVEREGRGRVRVAGYVPLGQLLPRCAAVVHHGGIGTTSQALAAGIPQLVCAMAFDQFDNGQRVKRLGCGEVLPMRRVTAGRLQAALEGLLTLERAHRVQELSQQVAPGPQAIKHAVAEILALLPKGDHESFESHE